MTRAANIIRFLVISDTHNLELEDCDQDFWKPRQKIDVLLHCGDLTHCGGTSSYKKSLKMLAAFDAELKLVIAGNHDLELDKEFWATHLEEGDDEEDHARALAVMTGPQATEAGVTYLEEGTHTFTLRNGAKFFIYTSPYSPEFCDWAFPYRHDEDRYNRTQEVLQRVNFIAEHPIPANVDIIMTHGPPKGTLDNCPQGSVGCPNLLQAVRRVRPLIHCFGHIHEGNGATVRTWGSYKTEQADSVTQSDIQLENPYPEPVGCTVKRGEQTLMVNAAIMDAKNQPVNRPWVVELELTGGK